MKNNLKNPCDECPFRKESAVGWLGGETVHDTYQHVMNEGNFACHKTRNKKSKEMSRCRGSLLFLKKAGKIPRYNKELTKAIKEIGKPDTTEILSNIEFFKHHDTY